MAEWMLTLTQTLPSPPISGEAPPPPELLPGSNQGGAVLSDVSLFPKDLIGCFPFYVLFSSLVRRELTAVILCLQYPLATPTQHASAHTVTVSQAKGRWVVVCPECRLPGSVWL